MYAIFEAKGKQWRAEEGATLQLPSLDAEPGETVEFDRVLLAERDGGEVLVGRPALEGASVGVEVIEHGKADKIIVFKRKKRKGYRRKQGHRQPYTEVRIVELDLEGATAPAPPEVEEEPAPEPEEAAPAAAEAAEEAPEPEAEVEEDSEPEADAAAEEIDATDAAGELAAEHGIDLAEIEGTGKEGRVLKSDVEAAVEALEEEEAETGEEASDEEAEPEPAGEIDVTGAAEELAEEHGIDLASIEGTGKDGRILKSDVQDAIDEREAG